jgi:hypothetical protein
VSYSQRPSGTEQFLELGLRPGRMYAPIMLAGCICSGLIAVWMLAHAFTGITIFAESASNVAVTMPTDNSSELTVFAVLDKEALQT